MVSTSSTGRKLGIIAPNVALADADGRIVALGNDRCYDRSIPLTGMF